MANPLGSVLLGCCLMGGAAFAEVRSEPVSADLPGGARLVMDLAEGWTYSTFVSNESATVRASPAPAAEALLLLTAIPLQAGRSLPTAETLREAVAVQGNSKLSSALQEELVIRELNGEASTTFLYHLTDRRVGDRSGEFREAHQGLILVGRLLCAVTIFAHTGDDHLVGEAEAMLLSARVLPPG